MAAIGFIYAWQKLYPVLIFRSVAEAFVFLKNRGKEGKAEKGKGGKTGKAEKAREKGKSEESLYQISVEIWRPPGGGCALRCLHAGLWNKEF